MTTFIRVVVGILVIAYGLVHPLYLISEPKDPKFPFTLGRSWLLPDDARRPTAAAMLVAFWNAQLVAGIVLDVGLIALALIRPEWIGTHLD